MVSPLIVVFSVGLLFWFLGYWGQIIVPDELAVWPPQWLRWLAGLPRQKKMDIQSLSAQIFGISIIVWQSVIVVLQWFGIQHPLLAPTEGVLLAFLVWAIVWIVLKVGYSRPPSAN